MFPSHCTWRTTALTWGYMTTGFGDTTQSGWGSNTTSLWVVSPQPVVIDFNVYAVVHQVQSHPQSEGGNNISVPGWLQHCYCWLCERLVVSIATVVFSSDYRWDCIWLTTALTWKYMTTDWCNIVVIHFHINAAVSKVQPHLKSKGKLTLLFLANFSIDMINFCKCAVIEVKTVSPPPLDFRWGCTWLTTALTTSID